MQKIAKPQELQAELRRLLAYCSGPERPSRERLASELRELAGRVALTFSGPPNVREDALHVAEHAGIDIDIFPAKDFPSVNRQHLKSVKHDDGMLIEAPLVRRVRLSEERLFGAVKSYMKAQPRKAKAELVQAFLNNVEKQLPRKQKWERTHYADPRTMIPLALDKRWEPGTDIRDIKWSEQRIVPKMVIITAEGDIHAFASAMVSFTLFSNAANIEPGDDGGFAYFGDQ